MRLACKKPIQIRDKIFGGEQALICLPLVSKNRDALANDSKELAALLPDLIEWRVDYYDQAADSRQVALDLHRFRSEIGNIPLIFTFRSFSEGGYAAYNLDQRCAAIQSALESGCVDIVDIELESDKAFIAQIIELVRKNNKKLILSYHDFNDTPDEKIIIDKLISAHQQGADIPKLAFMAHSQRDLLALFNATYRARTEFLDCPLVTMAMSEAGSLSRIVGGSFGSDMTFALGRESSAPGQVAIQAIREIWKNL